MPRITDSGIFKAPGPAGDVYERAGMHPWHGAAIQQVANDLQRIIISRCATPAGIQLLDEGYASKGFGIKAKSCDWGPFTGFAMADVHYAKLADGASVAALRKQQNFFNHGRDETGFSATDVGGRNSRMVVPGLYSSMAGAEILKLSKARLEYLKRQRVINFGAVSHQAMILCDTTPFGPMEFKMVDLQTSSTATWGIMRRERVVAGSHGNVQLQDGGSWELVRAMVNTSPGGTPTDMNRRCCTGDYDLWAVFPKRNSRVASTASLAKHGMERQLQSFSGAAHRVGADIQSRIGRLQQATLNQAVPRNHPQYGPYMEDREKGNISALTLHTARAMNRLIRSFGYTGGDMFHHNDDLGNPFRNDVEGELIAFIPGEVCPHFIESTKTGQGCNGHMGWNAWVRQFEADYVVYDNPAIHRKR